MVEGVQNMTLVDTGSQTSALTEGLCTEMGLKDLLLRNLIGSALHLEGIGFLLIPYKMYA